MAVCRSNGNRALSGATGIYDEYFLSETEPVDTCSAPSPPSPPQEVDQEMSLALNKHSR